VQHGHHRRHLFSQRRAGAEFVSAANWTRPQGAEASLQSLKKTKCNSCNPRSSPSWALSAGHHPRDQQSAQLRHDRPVTCEKRQAPRTGTAGGLRRGARRCRGRPQARADHRFRSSDVHASQYPSVRPVAWPMSSQFVSENRIAGGRHGHRSGTAR